jgi:hypothetical protein
MTSALILIQLAAFMSVASAFSGEPTISGKLGVSASGPTPQSVVGTFPTNPTYAIYYVYADAQCSDMLLASSVILDTCLANSNGSEMFSCGKDTYLPRCL